MADSTAVASNGVEATSEAFEWNFDSIMEMGIEYGIKIVGAIVALIVGLWIIKLILKPIRKVIIARDWDPSLEKFIVSMLNIILKTLLVVSVLQMAGVAVTSFVAILGAAGLAVGLALSGTLQNFAGGVMLLIFKPFKVGDVLEAQGYIGSVADIQIFNTILKTWDNKTVIIPNGGLSTGSMVNYSTEEERKVEWIFGIGYSDDIDKARKIIEDVIFSDERALDEAGSYFINVGELADSSVNFKVRATVKQEDYWGMFFEKTEAIKKAFDEAGISIPFPQQDVHMHQVN